MESCVNNRKLNFTLVSSVFYVDKRLKCGTPSIPSLWGSSIWKALIIFTQDPPAHRTHPSLFSIYIYYNKATIHRTTYPWKYLKPFCLCSLSRVAGLHHWKAAHKGGQIWTDAHFFLALTMVGSKDAHTSSVLATGYKHISLQNQTEWPTRGAFLHTNDDSEKLVKGAAPEFVDLRGAPKPAISHFALPTLPFFNVPIWSEWH